MTIDHAEPGTVRLLTPGGAHLVWVFAPEVASAAPPVIGWRGQTFLRDPESGYYHEVPLVELGAPFVADQWLVTGSPKAMVMAMQCRHCQAILTVGRTRHGVASADYPPLSLADLIAEVAGQGHLCGQDLSRP